jgi:hypothetical protein
LNYKPSLKIQEIFSELSKDNRKMDLENSKQTTVNDGKMANVILNQIKLGCVD